jgi:ABC-type glycerol-3-phosphate transport system substrate-binding protein
MENKTSIFQTVIIIVFVFAIVAGLLVFALKKSGGTAEENIPAVTMWGTLPQSLVDGFITSLNDDKSGRVLKVTYIEKREDSFDQDFIEALANNAGPDLLLLPSDRVLQYKNRVYPIPFQTISERSFRDTFLPGGEIFLDNNTVLALPFTADPLVMYWNRDALTAENVLIPPKDWGTFNTLAPKLTKKSQSGSITRSTVALGEFRNILNAKAVFSTLLLQAGTPIVKSSDGRYYNALTGAYGEPTRDALRFFTEFSNPIKDVYSWNKSLPLDRDAFLSGDLIFYFGNASELQELRQKNGNLNFDVAMVPQPKDTRAPVSFGTIYGLATLKTSPRIAAAYRAAQLLVSSDVQKKWSDASLLPPARRDVLQQEPDSFWGPVFYRSAVRTKAWLDPSPKKTKALFGTMVEDVVTGRSLPTEAIDDASRTLDSLFQ